MHVHQGTIRTHKTQQPSRVVPTILMENATAFGEDLPGVTYGASGNLD